MFSCKFCEIFRNVVFTKNLRATASLNSFTYLVCDSVLAVDILFVLDTSSGVGQENFNKMLQFVKEIIKVFDVNNQMTRVSVITYDSDARLVIRFTDYNNIDRLNTAIDAIQYVNGRQTRIDKALLLAGSAAYLSSNGGRDGYNKVRFTHSRSVASTFTNI